MRGNKYVRIPKKPRIFPDYGKGNCLYCGKALPPRHRKYCNNWHGELYRYESRDYVVTNWDGIRSRVLKRDGNVCKDCGDKAEEVHHVIPVHRGGDEYNMNNCISLCKNCHKKKHKKRMFEPRIGQKNISEFHSNFV